MFNFFYRADAEAAKIESEWKFAAMVGQNNTETLKSLVHQNILHQKNSGAGPTVPACLYLLHRDSVCCSAHSCPPCHCGVNTNNI